jgi:hypothetical protein
MFRVIFMFFEKLGGHVVMIKHESLGEYAQSLENLATIFGTSWERILRPKFAP